MTDAPATAPTPAQPKPKPRPHSCRWCGGTQGRGEGGGGCSWCEPWDGVVDGYSPEEDE